MPVLEYDGISPYIASSCFIAENAYIIGDVKIGQNCAILFGVTIRGDVNYIKIGDNTNIQDGSILHVTNETFPLIIGNNVSIGHGAKVHGCTIGNNVLIGIGAIVLDGSTIGDNCIIASGSVIREGEKIPANTFYAGVPAKFKREITEKDIERIRYSAVSYSEKIDFLKTIK